MNRTAALAIITVALSLALSVFVGPAARGESPGNLVANGDFGGSLSPWWSQGSGIRLQTVDGRSSVAVPRGMVVQERIAVDGRRNYRLSLETRSENAPDGSVYVQISFRGGSLGTDWAGPLSASVDDRAETACSKSGQPPLRSEKAAFVTGGDQRAWQRHTLVFTAPKEAKQMILYLRKRNCTAGIAHYADVSLAETDDPATEPADALRLSLIAERFFEPLPPGDNAARLARQIARGTEPPADHAVIGGGKLAMRVHVGRDEDLVTVKAAADLADFSARVAGADTVVPGLSDDLAMAEEPLMVVGRRNRLAERLFAAGEFAGLGEDGFLIRSFGPHIFIAGETPRGTMYGVNWFLDRRLGIRWLAPGATFIPAVPDLALPPQNERQVPRFSFREMLSASADDKPWRQRNLMNGESHGPSYLPSPPAIDNWNRSWAAKGLIANFYELLPPEVYRAKHPDWYAGGQLAMMNPAMRAEMARVVTARLQKLPDYRRVWFAIHDMDWGWDMDRESAAFAARHGGHPSAPRLDMMIDVAEKVRAVLPGARLAFNAYHWSFTPPEGMRVPDHILVYPMTIHVNYRDPLNGPANAKLGQDLAGWNAIAKHVLVWDHVTNFAGFIQPTPNIVAIGNSIRWLASLPHVEGYMAEGAFDTPGAEFDALRAWVISRLLWDPAQDPQALIDEFCDRYYGPASIHVRDYIRLLYTKLAASDDVLAEKTTVDMAMFDAEFVRVSEALFDKAEQAAAGTPYLERVRSARMPVDYVILLREAEYEALSEAVGFSVLATRAERWERFWSTSKSRKVRQYIQGGRLDELMALMNIRRKAASRPDIALGAAEWKDIQDMSFQRFAGNLSAITADPAASDGAAVALDRRSNGWNMQLKLDKLPPTGRWWLYVALRTEGSVPNQDVAKIGSAPPMDCYNTVRAHARSEKATYRWYEIPGGPFSYSTDHAQSVYVQPLPGPEGSTILVDRIAALSSPAAAIENAHLEGTGCR